MTPMDITGTTGSAMDFHSNPFVMLTFIVAPAVLTNGSAVLAMSTSNRFARAIDRARELAMQIESSTEAMAAEVKRLVNELQISENRALLLLKSLRSFYWAMASFALVTLASLLGALLTPLTSTPVDLLFLSFVLILGFSAVGGLVYGSVLLLRETQMVVAIIHDRIDGIQAKQWPKVKKNG